MKIYCILFITLFLINGCYGNYQNPNKSLPAKEVSIRYLLGHPTFFDMQGVIIKGKVWDLEYINLDYTVASFKLADKSGNFLDVISKDVLKIDKGNIIKVKGIFETNYNKESNTYEYYVNAKEIEVISND